MKYNVSPFIVLMMKHNSVCLCVYLHFTYFCRYVPVQQPRMQTRTTTMPATVLFCIQSQEMRSTLNQMEEKLTEATTTSTARSLDSLSTLIKLQLLHFCFQLLAFWLSASTNYPLQMFFFFLTFVEKPRESCIMYFLCFAILMILVESISRQEN